ncbi:MAG TPA: NUDIX domain-containing protein [Anaerolineales bacterium]|nr:NUDIX domain-containing protein [Anaerolineales bacterium]
MNQIRPIVLCVFRNNDRILVFEGHDPIKGEIFYRPLGGGIEFGESGEVAVRREIMEELHSEIEGLQHLGFLENIFTFNGKSHHEIVMIYDGVLKESRLYEQAEMKVEEANGEIVRALWKSLDEFEPGNLILYPDGLLNLLRAEIR